MTKQEICEKIWRILDESGGNMRERMAEISIIEKELRAL
jgi:hypothetical protein